MFWTNSSAGTVLSYASGTTSVLASQITSPRNIVVDGASSSGLAPVLYWTDFTNPGTVWYQKNGQTCPLATGENTPQGLYVDDTYVYWTDFVGDGVVRRIAKVAQ